MRGDYFLILSNRGGAEPLEVGGEFRAVGQKPPAAPAKTLQDA